MNASEGSFDCINVDRHCEFLINVKVGFYLYAQEEQTHLDVLFWQAWRLKIQWT